MPSKRKPASTSPDTDIQLNESQAQKYPSPTKASSSTPTKRLCMDDGSSPFQWWQHKFTRNQEVYSKCRWCKDEKIKQRSQAQPMEWTQDGSSSADVPHNQQAHLDRWEEVNSSMHINMGCSLLHTSPQDQRSDHRNETYIWWSWQTLNLQQKSRRRAVVHLEENSFN